MSIRTDISINWELSPRIITVAAPSVEVTMQDLLDTLRYRESLPENLDDPPIISASGKEPLGGGILVGITVTLLNAKLAFEPRSGPTYTVCDAGGGNLVAFDSLGAEINPIFPTAFTQIVKTSSASATLSDLSAIQYASYAGGVWVGVAGVAGTEYPIGTAESPVNNLADAHEIAEERGFSKFFFVSDYTFASDIVLTDGYEFHGESSQKTTFTFEAGCILALCQVHKATCTGFESGIVGFNDSLLFDLGSVGLAPSSVNVVARNCLFKGFLRLPSNYSGTVTAIDCWALPDDSGSPPVIDHGNSTADIQVRNWSGLLTFENITQTVDIRVFFNSGGSTLDPSVTAGDFLFSGVGTLTDNSTSSDKVNTDGLVSKELISDVAFSQVYLDVNSSNTGTDFPKGTLAAPVNNLTDAIAIAVAHNLITISVAGHLVLDQAVNGYIFKGWKAGTIDLNGQLSLYTQLVDLQVEGTQNGYTIYDNCRVKEIANLDGSLQRCAFLNSTTMTVAINATLYMNDCRSAVPGSDSPTFDFSAGGIGCNCRAYSGGLQVINSTDAANISTFEFIAGKFNFGVTNTDGYFAVRGVIDTSGIDTDAGATVAHTGAISNDTISDAVWDEVLTGATRNVPASAGRRLRQLSSAIIYEGDAVSAGVGPNQIVFASDAADYNGAYDPAMVTIVEGSGLGQTRLVLQYDGATRTAVVDRDWKVAPDSSSLILITANAGREHVNEGLAQGGTTNTITLNANASSFDDSYVGQSVFIRSGTGEDQSQPVIAYNGTTKVATLEHDWHTAPDTTSGYVMMPQHIHLVEHIADAVWDATTGARVDSNTTITRKQIANKAVISADDLTVTIYDDDGTTPLYLFDISEDKRIRTPQ